MMITATTPASTTINGAAPEIAPNRIPALTAQIRAAESELAAELLRLYRSGEITTAGADLPALTRAPVSLPSGEQLTLVRRGGRKPNVPLLAFVRENFTNTTNDDLAMLWRRQSGEEISPNTIRRLMWENGLKRETQIRKRRRRRPRAAN